MALSKAPSTRQGESLPVKMLQCRTASLGSETDPHCADSGAARGYVGGAGKTQNGPSYENVTVCTCELDSVL